MTAILRTQSQQIFSFKSHRTFRYLKSRIAYQHRRKGTLSGTVGLIVNGYAKEVLNKLPMEFAVEAQKLLAISLEGSVG